MYTEIERKWLFEPKKIPYDLSSLPKKELQQAYVCFSPCIRIRSIDNEKFYLTVKAKKAEDASGLERHEFEIEITKPEYDYLLKKTEGNIITKTRYLVKKGDLTEEIDFFHGSLEGICYMEIEFPSVEDAENYPDPEWVKMDVSLIHEYQNTALAQMGRPEI